MSGRRSAPADRCRRRREAAVTVDRSVTRDTTRAARRRSASPRQQARVAAMLVVDTSGSMGDARHRGRRVGGRRLPPDASRPTSGSGVVVVRRPTAGRRPDHRPREGAARRSARLASKGETALYAGVTARRRSAGQHGRAQHRAAQRRWRHGEHGPAAARRRRPSTRSGVRAEVVAFKTSESQNAVLTPFAIGRRRQVVAAGDRRRSRSAFSRGRARWPVRLSRSTLRGVAGTQDSSVPDARPVDRRSRRDARWSPRCGTARRSPTPRARRPRRRRRPSRPDARLHGLLASVLWPCARGARRSSADRPGHRLIGAHPPSRRRRIAALDASMPTAPAAPRPHVEPGAEPERDRQPASLHLGERVIAGRGVDDRRPRSWSGPTCRCGRASGTSCGRRRGRRRRRSACCSCAWPSRPVLGWSSAACSAASLPAVVLQLPGRPSRPSSSSSSCPTCCTLVAAACARASRLPQALDAVVRDAAEPVGQGVLPGAGRDADRRRHRGRLERHGRSGWTATTCAGPPWRSASSARSAATWPRRCAPPRRRCASARRCSARCARCPPRAGSRRTSSSPCPIGVFFYMLEANRDYVEPAVDRPARHG